jgi:hypothetical protein
MGQANTEVKQKKGFNERVRQQKNRGFGPVIWITSASLLVLVEF